MIRHASRAALVLGLFAVPGAALAQPGPEPIPGEWGSGYQMGVFWAGVTSPAGDSFSLSCGDGGLDAPMIQKGMSVRAELAVIAEKGMKTGERVDVAIGTEGAVVTLKMVVDGGASMSLADEPAEKAKAKKLVDPLSAGSSVSLVFGSAKATFALKKSKDALQGVTECAFGRGGD